MHTIKYHGTHPEESRASKAYCRVLMYEILSDHKDGESRLRSKDIDASPVESHQGTRITVAGPEFDAWPKNGKHRGFISFRVYADKPSKIPNEYGALAALGAWSVQPDKPPYDPKSPEGRIEAAFEKIAEQYRREKAAEERARIANLIANTLVLRADKAARELGFNEALKALEADFEKKRRKLFEEQAEELRKDPTIIYEGGEKKSIEPRVLEAGLAAAEKIWPPVISGCLSSLGRNTDVVEWESML